MDTLRIGIELRPEFDKRLMPLYNEFGIWFTALCNYLALTYDSDSGGPEHVDDVVYVKADKFRDPLASIEIRLATPDSELLKAIVKETEDEFLKVKNKFGTAILLTYNMATKI